MANSTDTPREPGRPEDADPAAPRLPEDSAAAPESTPADAPDPARPAGAIEDAEILSETPPPAEEAAPRAEADSPAEAEASGTDPDTDTPAAEDGPAPQPDEGEAQPRDDDTAAPGVGEAALLAGAGLAAGATAAAAAGGGDEARANAARPAAAIPAPPAETRGGMMPLLLGGAIAAGLGAGALWFLDREGILRLSGAGIETLQTDLNAQGTRIDGLAATLGGVADDLAAQADRIAAAETAAETATAGATEAAIALGGRVEGVETALARVDAQLAALEALPIAGDPEAMRILDAYRDEVAGLRAEMATLAAQGAALIAAAEAANARAEAAESQLDGIAEEAAAAETRARARAALRLVETAFTSGGPFAAALDDIAAAGIAPPGSLPELAGQGVPTLADLRAGFPAGARTALEIALRDVQDRPLSERMVAFLRLQFGMRSLSPREGGDADAVLSRAEAALAAGDLDAALAELDALAEPVRAPLGGFIAAARTRRAAEADLAALTAAVESL